MPHTLESVRPQLERLAALRDGRRFSVTVHASSLASPEEIAVWEALGVDRLIVRPWKGTGDAVTKLTAFAADHGLTPDHERPFSDAVRLRPHPGTASRTASRTADPGTASRDASRSSRTASRTASRDHILGPSGSRRFPRPSGQAASTSWKVGKVFLTQPGSSRVTPGTRNPVTLKAMAMRWSPWQAISAASGVPGWISIQSRPVRTSTPQPAQVLLAGRQAVALLHAGVVDVLDADGAGGERGDGGEGRHGVGDVAHVDRDARQPLGPVTVVASVVISTVAPMRCQDVDEAQVALEAVAGQAGDGDRTAGERGGGEEVARAGGVGLDLVGVGA
ncbi:hypothetical protein GCM10020219_068740 [Nonomuraea dietziae]